MNKLIEENGGTPPKEIKADEPYNSTTEEERQEEERRRNIIKEFYITEFVQDESAECYKSAKEGAMTCDLIGANLKEASGQSINVLLKMNCLIALIFSLFFIKTGYFSDSFSNVTRSSIPSF